MLLGKGALRYPHPGWMLVLAICAGTVKSFVILDKSAVRIISRISSFSGKVWLPAVYPLQTWLLVIAMMTFGILLKYSSAPTIVLFFVYCMVGWGLLFSGRKMWHAFFTLRECKEGSEK